MSNSEWIFDTNDKQDNLKKQDFFIENNFKESISHRQDNDHDRVRP